MVELEIFDEDKKEISPVRLKLRREICGEVLLEAVDSRGKRFSQGTLLKITKKGIIKICNSFDESLGFQIDKRGHIKVEKS